ncbi:hypothetical protein BABINDRAFT_52126 [Babjeviella inositovora NRRL Y-12698]|uniref:Membrane magnesium transporter n=1 Tax=Babjeviella inositovora NRRL Y-12698 TaxID=984486 RepID=A0A1E3QL10_9ASCO|nr:uncharacterized protein BABINDRAFT_52126 [Babjeviella inositovora NRRL Y-12698]ODQ78373.1 hypothetical protein BABINDRAFT_52126 [Babjeviella inositovora NRRL Y-12698]
MSFKSSYLYALGALFLFHSGYSAMQFYQYVKATDSTLPLPTDIGLEALLGAAVTIIAAVFSVEIPAQLSAHDDEVLVKPYRFFKPIEMRYATTEFQKLGINPFEEIEARPAFMNIVAKRKEFQEWANK